MVKRILFGLVGFVGVLAAVCATNAFADPPSATLTVTVAVTGKGEDSYGGKDGVDQSDSMNFSCRGTLNSKAPAGTPLSRMPTSDGDLTCTGGGDGGGHFTIKDKDGVTRTFKTAWTYKIQDASAKRKETLIEFRDAGSYDIDLIQMPSFDVQRASPPPKPGDLGDMMAAEMGQLAVQPTAQQAFGGVMLQVVQAHDSQYRPTGLLADLHGSYDPKAASVKKTGGSSQSYTQPGTNRTGSVNINYELNYQGGPTGIQAIHGPYPQGSRGVRLSLDGSRSVGKNLTYEWTFSPKNCPEGVVPKADARKTGAKASVVLLCDTDITLKVSDGKGQDSKTLPALVKRNWRTVLSHVKQPQYYADSLYVGTVGQTLLGSNRCAEENPDAHKDTGDKLHRPHEDLATWKDVAYTLGQVQDPNGPFDGLWYVASKNLKVSRMSFIDADLAIGSAVDQKNMQVDRALKKTTHDVRTLINQINAHELMHTTLMQELLDKEGFDPAKKIEAMISDKDADLQDKVDFVLRDAESQLRDSTTDDKVRARLEQVADFNRSGKVLLPTDSSGASWEDWNISNFAALGAED